MQKRLILMLLLFMVVSVSLFAGTTGKLAGKITDKKDGKPVPFANIVLAKDGVGVTGGMTKDNGTFFIINIPPGTYEMRVSQGSYHPATVTGVQINLDETSVANAELILSTIPIEGLVVTENQIVKISKTKTGSGTTLNLEELEGSSVESIDDAISLTAGVESVNGEIHVRGGRSNEVVYTVDGLSVSDPVDGGSSLSIDMDAVQVMDVQTGGFTAEFGNAQSGIINIITKDGGANYSGKVEVVSDHVVNSWDNSNSDEVKLAIGGPLLGPFASGLKDKLTFFINGTANWYDSRYHNYYASDPNEDLPNLMNTYSYEDPFKGDKDFVNFDRNYNLYSANFKTKYKFSNKANATLAVRGNSTDYTPYAHSWRYALDHYVEVDDQLRQYIATYDQTFNAYSNLKVKGSMLTKTAKRGPIGIDRDDYFVKIEGNAWEVENGFDLYSLDDNNRNYTGMSVLTTDGLVGSESNLEWSYLSDGTEKTVPGYNQPGSVYNTNVDDETQTFSFKTDFEYQPNQIHGIKTGIEIIKYSIKKDRLYNPWIINETRYDSYLSTATPVDFVAEGDPLVDNVEGSPSYGDTLISAVAEDLSFYSQDDLYAATIAASGDTDGYEADPWQGAYYLQDKMEWEGMIINAGLRFDMWYLGEKYKRIKSGGLEEWYHFEDDEKFQLMVSPRFGISHPISDKSVVHFAYNYQNQLPQMQYVFTSASPEDAIGSSADITIGEPQLEPQITVTYEVGLRKALNDNYSLDIQAYFKNIYNYVTTEKVYLQDNGDLVSYTEAQLDESVDISVPLYRYISEDYGSVRGIDINLSRGLSNHIQGSASYSLSWSEGNNSGLTVQDEATSLREFPLDWDSRHSFSSNLTFRVAKNEPWEVPFTDYYFPMDDFSLNFSYSIRSGSPYTPQTDEGTAMDTNSETMPHYENADLKFTKTFSLGEDEKQYFRAYAKIGNLFNRRNINDVYAKTGSAYYDGEDISEPGTDYVAADTEQIYNSANADPSRWSVGRTLSVGVSFHF